MEGGARAFLTSGLKNEADYITRKERLCDPTLFDYGVMLAIRQPDNASQDHVNGGGEQRRAEQDVHALDDVRHHLPAARF